MSDIEEVETDDESISLNGVEYSMENSLNDIENGFFVQMSTSTPIASSESDNEENEQPNQSVRQFNIAIPTVHKYLGSLNNIDGYSWFEDSEIIKVVAIVTNTWVFPGFTLPLVMYDQHESHVMRQFIQNDKVFVLLCCTDLLEYGVTMEAFQMKTQNNILSLKAKARQRCMVVPGSERSVLVGRLQLITVKILPEHKLPPPLTDTQLYVLKQKRPFTVENYDQLKTNRSIRKYHLAQFPFPSFVYEENEVCYILMRIRNGLRKIYSEEAIPTDPYTLSFWFVQNYLLENEERLHILKQETVIKRLKFEVSCLDKSRTIRCIRCNIEIAKQANVFIMSKDGIESNYCNPGGYVHEVITVSKATNIRSLGGPSSQFSWFPGYHWISLKCNCHHHLGWKFLAMKNPLVPKKFFGLSRGSLMITKDEETSFDTK